MDALYRKALQREDLTVDEAVELYVSAPTGDLVFIADTLRREAADPSVVTWQIDRNVNITNVCVSGCKFCNFHCKVSETERAFITSIEQYSEKIEYMLELAAINSLCRGGSIPGSA